MSDKTVDVSSINKFDGQNYHQWKFQIKCALKAKGIYEVADGSSTMPAAAGDINKWIKNDSSAMFMLTAAMTYSQITLIENCNSAKEILDKLDSIYLLKSETNKMVLHERFHSYKMDSNDSVAQHIAKVENLAKQIKDAGDTVSNAAIMTKILNTLPVKFRNIRQAWLSLDESKQTIQNLTARLLDEEASLTSIEEAEIALAAVSVKDSAKKKPFTVKCYKCHKRGHIARNCHSKAKEQSSSSASAFSVEQNTFFENSNCWIMDSGASAHMSHCREYFSNLKEVENANVILGNNQTLPVKGKGVVKVQKLVNNKWCDATINNVLYVPDLKKNLFSEGVVTEKGMKINKDNVKAEIFDKSELVAVAERDPSTNLYKMMFCTEVFEVNVTSSESLKVWHERLGHISVKTIQEMVSKGLIQGIDLSEIDTFFCEACAYGKQHMLPFKKVPNEKMKLGERIFSDVCGPMDTPSVRGLRYFVIFKDDLSGFREVNFIKHKSDVFSCFKDFANRVKNHFGHAIKVFHSDNGSEYVNHEFKNYFSKEGIRFEFTAPYTPQQNGRVERDNRTIVESARAMIYGSGVAKFLWAEAVNTAVYILNRTQTTQAPNSTPFELWYGKKPCLGHMRTFGVEAYSLIPEQKRSKLDPKSKKYIFVGYDQESNNYRLFDPLSKKVIVSRNVLFNEKVKYNGPVSEAIPLVIEQDENDEQDNFTQEGNRVENEENEVEEEIDNMPKLRPQRSANIPKRYEEYILNFAEVDTPQTYEEALNSDRSEDWGQAIKEELDSHHKNETWQLCKLPTGKQIISSKWVFKVKRSPEGNISRFKARLCAKGFSQKKGVDYDEVFAPTIRYDSIRVLMAVAAQNNFKMKQFDIKTAFLYGDLKEELFMMPPKGLKCDPGLVCKLKKSLYGLKQSPRCWNEKFNSFLENFGFIRSNADRCVYQGEFHNVRVLLILYVDDGIVMSSDITVIDEVLSKLQKQFEITVSDVNYFVGMQITQNEDGSIFVSQEQYIKQTINRFKMSDANPVSTPGDSHVNLSYDESKVLEENDVPYRQAVGSLMFSAICTRVDIAHSVGVVSRYLNNPTISRWNAVKRILKYLLGTSDLGITYRKEESFNLVGFSDSDYASDYNTRHSTSGYLFKLCGGPVTWSSKKQSSVCLSTTEAEYVAAAQAAKEAIWLQELLQDIGEQIVKPTPIYIDNQSAIKLIHNPEHHSRTKHIDIKYHFVREKYEEGIIVPLFVDTNNQEADLLTKPLTSSKFNRNVMLLGLSKGK